MTHFTLDQIFDLTLTALQGAGANAAQAGGIAAATVRAEQDGIRSHGLMYVPIYGEHVRCGKVRGDAVPQQAMQFLYLSP